MSVATCLHSTAESDLETAFCLELPSATERPTQAACLIKLYPTADGPGMFSLDDVRTTLGRDTVCHLPLPHDSVSRVHATIHREGESYRVTDEASTNGTFVNGVRIESAELTPGDQLKVGNHIFKFLAGNDVEAQYHEAAFRLMITDGLTGAYNKRYLLDALEREHSRATRTGRTVSLMLLDLDHFKQVNDTWGHLAGDEVLQECCRRIPPCLREYDVFARFGGEEFAAVVCEVPPKMLVEVADRIRRRIAGEPFVTSGGSIHTTLSIGVACIRGESDSTIERLIQTADANLYEAKRRGRNRVVGTWANENAQLASAAELAERSSQLAGGRPRG